MMGALFVRACMELARTGTVHHVDARGVITPYDAADERLGRLNGADLFLIYDEAEACAISRMARC